MFHYFNGTFEHEIAHMYRLNLDILEVQKSVSVRITCDKEALQTLQDFPMLRSQLLTQIQPIPVNSARRSNLQGPN